MTATKGQRLAEFCVALGDGGAPPAARDAAGPFLLDYLANAIGGSATGSAGAARRFLAAQGLAGPSTALGVGQAPAQYAALVNGVSAHSLEMDDTHQPSSLHPGATVFSAALALLDDGGDGSRFAPAVVAGYEVACRIGMAVQPKAHYDQGFHPTATCGVFGAAATAALLLGLDAPTLSHAFGIAGSMSAGLMEFLTDGSWTKRMHPGWAAHSGILAARLAQAGYTGPDTVFEGRAGFLHAYSPSPNPDALTSGLGSDFQILRTSIKAHACCRYKQAPIDSIIALMQSHGLREADVDSVTIDVLDAGWNIIVEPEERKRAPHSVVDAQFSMPYGAAIAMLYERASPAEYRPELLTDAAVQRAMAKVRCRRNPALDAEFPALWPAIVSLRTTDGRDLSLRTDHPKGDPENPLSPLEMEAKFRTLTADVLAESAQDRMIAATAAIGEHDGPARLATALRETNTGLIARLGHRTPEAAANRR